MMILNRYCEPVHLVRTPQMRECMEKLRRILHTPDSQETITEIECLDAWFATDIPLEEIRSIRRELRDRRLLLSWQDGQWRINTNP